MEDATQKNMINALYVVLILSTIFGFMPNMMAQVFSLVVLTIVLLVAYIFRAMDTKDGLLYNHMTYMIGTIIISSGFFIFSLMAVGLWVYTKGDQTVIHDAMNQIQYGEFPNEDQLMTLQNDYIETNKGLLWMASIVSVGPSILYLVYRLANGFSRAWQGYRIANPKSWL